MEDPSKPYPFGLEGVRSMYQNAIHHLFVNHIERDHVTNLYMIDPTDSGQPTDVATWWIFASSQRFPFFQPNLSTMS